MIGLALVVFVAVFAQGLKTSFIDSLARSNRAAVVVTDDSGTMALPARGAAAVRALPGVRVATGVAVADAKVNGSVTQLGAVEPHRFGSVWHFNWIKGGSDRLLARLNGSTAIVEEQFAKSNHLRIGSRVSVVGQSGRRLTLTVIGEHRDPMVMNGMVVGDHVFRRLGAPARRRRAARLGALRRGRGHAEERRDQRRWLATRPRPCARRPVTTTS